MEMMYVFILWLGGFIVLFSGMVGRLDRYVKLRLGFLNCRARELVIRSLRSLELLPKTLAQFQSLVSL